MSISRFIYTAVLLVVLSFSGFAQRASRLRISEVMPSYVQSLPDGTGLTNRPWIELYNSSTATVDLKGCYLTDDPNKLNKYRIPAWSRTTQIPPGEFILLWADGRAQEGVLHLGFELKADQPNFLALVDADGLTIIDSLSIPVVPSGYSYQARALKQSLEVGAPIVWEVSEAYSPKNHNDRAEDSDKVEKLKELDSSGLGMTITSVMVVFVALLLLCFVFLLIGKIMKARDQAKVVEDKQKSSAPGLPTAMESVAISLALSQALANDTDLHAAVIAMALNKHKALSEHEDLGMKLTMKPRPKSDWNAANARMRVYRG